MVPTPASSASYAEYEESDMWTDAAATKHERMPTAADGFTFVDEYGNAVDECFEGLQLVRIFFVTLVYTTFLIQINGEEVTVLDESHSPSGSVSAYKKPLTYYKCDICGKLLRYPSKIEEHRRSHTGEKVDLFVFGDFWAYFTTTNKCFQPFPCSQCHKRFTQKGALRCHERLHTGCGVIHKEICPTINVSGEKPYLCRWDCGRGFVSASARLMHENTHAGIRSFACKFCGQLFAKKYHVERHEKRHKHLAASAKVLTGLEAAGDHLFSLLDAVTVGFFFFKK
jgi:hypothetical protein